MIAIGMGHMSHMGPLPPRRICMSHGDIPVLLLAGWLVGVAPWHPRHGWMMWPTHPPLHCMRAEQRCAVTFDPIIPSLCLCLIASHLIADPDPEPGQPRLRPHPVNFTCKLLCTLLLPDALAKRLTQIPY
jgi:hypothetical protein